MLVTVVENEEMTVALIVDADDVTADTLVDTIRKRLGHWSEETNFVQYSSDDVVLTVDGDKVNN